MLGGFVAAEPEHPYVGDANDTQHETLLAAYDSFDAAAADFEGTFSAAYGAPPTAWQRFTDSYAAYKPLVDGDFMDAAFADDPIWWAQSRKTSGLAETGATWVESLTTVGDEVAAAAAVAAAQSAVEADRTVRLTVRSCSSAWSSGCPSASTSPASCDARSVRSRSPWRRWRGVT